jgi:pyocin large subunit-like protein
VTEPPLLRGGDGVRLERTWGDSRDMAKQFGRHGREFQTTSIFRYAAMAAYFFQEAPDRGFPTKIGEDGVIRIYDPGSNTYGEYNPDGTTRTFLRPERGSAFWAEQPGVEAISP